MSKLKDDMYRAVTGSVLTNAFTEDDLKQINCTDWVSSQFEDWTEEMLSNHITDLVSAILTYFISPTE